MISLRRAFSILSIISLLFVSCAEDGAVGPVGPVGPEGQLGPAGDPGQDGTDGQDGKDGVANISTRTYTVLDTDWNGTGRAPKYNPDITASVVTNGVVSVFRTTTPLPADSNTTWRSVPDDVFAFDYKKDTVGLLVPGFTGANFTTYYKVIVIPPAEKVAGVNYNNWEDIKMVHGLTDEAF